MWVKILNYIITLVIFLILDFAWIGFIAKKIYAKHLGYIMRKKPNWWAAILFYLLYIFGITVFVLSPALNQSSPMFALLYGGLFGLVAYSTYDLTNLATTKDWPDGLTFVDMVWGCVLSAMTCYLSYLIIGVIV
jgi:uncharacterized membrane protein